MKRETARLISNDLLATTSLPSPHNHNHPSLVLTGSTTAPGTELYELANPAESDTWPEILGSAVHQPVSPRPKSLAVTPVTRLSLLIVQELRGQSNTGRPRQGSLFSKTVEILNPTDQDLNHVANRLPARLPAHTAHQTQIPGPEFLSAL